MIYMLYSLISCQYFSFHYMSLMSFHFFILDSKNSYMCLYELHSDLKRIVFSSFFVFVCCFNIAVSHRWRWLKRLVASRGLTPCSRHSHALFHSVSRFLCSCRTSTSIMIITPSHLLFLFLFFSSRSCHELFINLTASVFLFFSA